MFIKLSVLGGVQGKPARRITGNEHKNECWEKSFYSTPIELTKTKWTVFDIFCD